MSFKTRRKYRGHVSVFTLLGRLTSISVTSPRFETEPFLVVRICISTISQIRKISSVIPSPQSSSEMRLGELSAVPEPDPFSRFQLCLYNFRPCFQDILFLKKRLNSRMVIRTWVSLCPVSSPSQTSLIVIRLRELLSALLPGLSYSKPCMSIFFPLSQNPNYLLACEVV